MPGESDVKCEVVVAYGWRFCSRLPSDVRTSMNVSRLVVDCLAMNNFRWMKESAKDGSWCRYNKEVIAA